MTEFAVPATRREAVLEQLRQEIISGELSPGAPVRDAEIAGRLGVSITPVREAIAQLGLERLVDIQPNRKRTVVVLTRESALELVDVVELLSCAGFAWGVGRLDDTHFVRLRERLAEFDASYAAGNLVAAGRAGLAFGDVVIGACGNSELLHQVDLVFHRTRRLFATVTDGPVWTIWLQGCHQVLAHLESWERDAAVSRYRRIYTDLRARMAELPLPQSAAH
ncbi:GntR family transcriptional regulator [Streptomyces albipurpureus]|uniref:GntR family transcriptional regulator n=1 Tax=Streptomyces albipurpureus TaxID=2897419 RepID=A0ABT0UHB2_9ACTN|nr:GntR family transcriptional regulator [Streptomyces sp. CWNU-1]MCM2387561.1 GntR family transcriptional regulator [Streptomyces sp. CWNU-1]